MSERDNNGYDVEQKRKARTLLAAAMTEMADSHEVTEGGLITGWIAVAEITLADGRSCLWLTGNGGTPDDDHTEGLDSWRVEGLVRKVIRDLDCGNVSDE